MPHINIPSQLPGITGLLEARLDSAEPIRDITQFILRAPNSLTEGERELIASIVCSGNECRFCTSAHTTVAARYLGSMDVVREIIRNPFSGHVSPRIASLLVIARSTGVLGKEVTEEMVQVAKETGATELEIHDTVLIAALFAFYNRYVDGLATDLPIDESYFDSLAERLTTTGYTRRQPVGTH